MINWDIKLHVSMALTPGSLDVYSINKAVGKLKKANPIKIIYHPVFYTVEIDLAKCLKSKNKTRDIGFCLKIINQMSKADN